MSKQIPKTETVWKQSHTPNGDFIITSDHIRSKYTLWKVETSGVTKLKTAATPDKLEEFLTPLWGDSSNKTRRKKT